MPPKNLRRSHTKSKAGCSQCKIRRIKCNETRPICSNCERRQITCDFSLSPGDSNSTPDKPASSIGCSRLDTLSRNGSSQGSAPIPTPDTDPLLSPRLVSTKKTTELDVDDLELMHHWTSVVAADIGDNGSAPSHVDIWQLHIPSLAFKHDFLLRGILCISAIHLGYAYPQLKTDCDLKASTHQDRALASFQETLPLMDESNCHALFAFSCLLIPIAFATSTRDRADQGSQTDLFHWIYLLRGGNSILQVHRELLQNGFLGPMLATMTHTETTEVYSVPNADKISALFKLCNAIDDEDASQACTLAVHTLLSTFIQASLLRKRREGAVLSTLVWPVHLSPKFLELLGERKAEALVILAHYCVLIHWGTIDGTWFLVGWARSMLDALKASMEETWLPMIAWPESIIDQ